MRVWIDLVNSPHVPFFMPIIKQLETQGHTVLITYRDFAQTKALVKNNNLSAVLIDGHGGRSKLGKGWSLVNRTWRLCSFARKQRISLALSHNSYFQILAAKLLNIPSITSMDFEGQQANHLAFRLATKVILPQDFPSQDAQKFGVESPLRYSGLKEDICLSQFSQDPDALKKLTEAFKLSDQDLAKPIVLVRTPPSLALYHNDEESLFEHFLKKLEKSDVTVLILPRVDSQKVELAKRYPGFKFSNQVLNGFDLICLVDYVASAGGSMNREAAVLNTPVFSLFSGELPAVDKALSSQGKLICINKTDQIDSIKFEKKSVKSKIANRQALEMFMEHINKFIGGK